MPDEIPKKVSKIISDNKTGSRGLTSAINSFFLSNIAQIENFSRYIKTLKNELDSFHGIISYLEKLEEALPNPTKTKEYLESYEKEEKSAFDKLFAYAHKELCNYNRFMTISNSKTVTELLLKLAEVNKKLEVIVCESRPVFEGRITAENLADKGIPVTLITEAQAAYFMKLTDAVITGADKILQNNGVVNKTGSLLLAILAKNFGIPFYVITDSGKFTSAGKTETKLYPFKEIWENKPENVFVKNFYFETVEKGLITKIITDK